MGSATARELRAWLGAAVLLLAGCTTPPAATSGPWQTATLGLCEDYPEETRSLERARADLKAAHDAGARVLRIAFGWDAMEPERGRYDWSFWDEFVRMATDDYGLRLIPYVCYTPAWAATDQGGNSWRSPPRNPEDFARFLTVLVGRYRHAIQSWELWNEPDNRAYWLGTPTEFAALVRAGSRAVRAADPQASVVLGGIAGETDFLDELFRVQRIAPAVDVVNIHSYFETWHPDPIESLPRYVERAAEIVREHGENEPLWMAETGYSSVGGRAAISDVYRAHFRGEHSRQAQAIALARTLVLALTTGQLPLVAWYRINDLPTTEDVIGDDNNRHLGIRDVSGKPKPAFATFELLAQWFRQPFRVLRPEVRLTAAHRASAPEIHAFALRDGRQILVAWLGTPTTKDTRPLAGSVASELPVDSRHVTVQVRLPQTRAAAVRITDGLGNVAARDRAAWQMRRGGVAFDLNLRGGELLICELTP